MLYQGGLAKVESITTKENMTSLRISCRGTGKSGKEYTDYKGFVTLFNDAHEKAVDLNVGDSIKVLDLKISSKYTNNTNYTNLNIYDIEIIPNEDVDGIDEELPFS